MSDKTKSAAEQQAEAASRRSLVAGPEAGSEEAVRIREGKLTGGNDPGVRRVGGDAEPAGSRPTPSTAAPAPGPRW
jgi:hypothetical protein